MDYFKGNKYQSIHENVPYIASEIFNILFKPKTLDKIISEYVSVHKINKNSNIEKNIKLALIFLYSVGKVDYNNIIITRVD
ncbi:hypothetical protein [Clostridium sp. CTA-1]